MVNKCMRTCTQNHVCSEVLPARMPPRRLLAMDEKRVRWVSRRALDRYPQYITLSYCWGGYIGLRLDKFSFQRFEARIGDDLLPQTILDAAIVARRLEIPFLWVDALCILQDDGGLEWQCEWQRMHEIYGNAVFTLAASSSENTNAGLMERHNSALFDVPDVGPCAGEYIELCSSPLSRIRQRSPLSGRGWTFQEELMSPRIVHWSNQGVFWLCMGERCSSTGVDVKRESFNPQAFWTHQSPLDLWADMVENFSNRAFTVPSDRPRALAGLVEIIRRKVSDDYLSGHWKSQLPISLLWISSTDLNDQRVEIIEHVELAPSWSWMSIPPSHRIKMRKDHSPGQSQSKILAKMVHNGSEGCTAIHGPLLSLLPNMKEVPWPCFSSDEPVEEIASAEMQLNRPCFAIGTSQIIVCQDPRHPVIIHIDHESILSPEDLCCLQITEDAFLLLSRIDGQESKMSYRRVGCAPRCDDRSFFDNAKPDIVKIV